MNMNESVVNHALMLAGNNPLTPKDRENNNLPFKYAKEIYLNLLFNCLSEIEWRSARRWYPITLSHRHGYKEEGLLYYEIPAECIRPIRVENGNFQQEETFIVCDQANERLYCVFHRRKKNFNWTAPSSVANRDRALYIERPRDIQTERDPFVLLRRAKTQEEVSEIGNVDEDFPEWEFTDYEVQFWKYFQYKLAAELVLKLTNDYQRYMVLIQTADKFGEEAIQSSRGSSENEKVTLTWLDKVGLRTYNDVDSRPRSRRSGLKQGF